MYHSFQQIQEVAKLKNPDIITDGLDKGERFIQLLQRRVVKYNKNFNCLVLGDTGSGKSFACLRMGERLDPKFNIDKVVFSKKEFMEQVLKAEKGSVIVYEEAGVSLASRQWWKNFGSNVVMQTFRYKNLILIMNCPVISFVDKNSVSLIHATFKMMGIDSKEKISRMRPIMLDTDGQFNFTKKAYPVIDGALITEIKVHIPSTKLVRQYELKAKAFKDNLGQKYLNEEIAKEQVSRFGKNPNAKRSDVEIVNGKA